MAENPPGKSISHRAFFYCTGEQCKSSICPEYVGSTWMVFDVNINKPIVDRSLTLKCGMKIFRNACLVLVSPIVNQYGFTNL